MECTELMLDDWVLDTYTGKPMRVQVVKIKVGKGLEPIPITPEILEKNGWTYNDVDKVFYPAQLRGELPYMVGMNGVFRVQDFCEIRYVHELQHALKLCGIDKEIVV